MKIDRFNEKQNLIKTQILINKNKIAQGDVSIFNQLPFFLILYIFLTENTYLINKILSNALSTGPNQWNKIQNFDFGSHFVLFLKTRLAITSKGNQPILLIFDSKHGMDFYFNVLKFEQDRSKIATVRVTHSKTAIMAAMTSSNLNFQNRRKTDLANVLQVICGKFNQNWSIHLGCRDDTDTQTDRQTDRQTDTQTPWGRLQHIQSN